jgi:hypothetical protein
VEEISIFAEFNPGSFGPLASVFMALLLVLSCGDCFDKRQMDLLPRTKQDLLRIHALVSPKSRAPAKKADLVREISDKLPSTRTVKVAYPRIPKRAQKRLLEILRGVDWERIGRTVARGRHKRKISHTFSKACDGRQRVGIGLTLGVTRGVPGTSGFGEDGFNRKLVAQQFRHEETRLRELWDELKALLKTADPKFSFSSVQVNYNFPSERSHLDNHNRGPSYTLSLGRFTGGQLLVGTDDPQTLLSFDTRNRLTFCDARHPHWVAPYQGERYSLVCFRLTGKEEARRSNLACVPPKPLRGRVHCSKKY